MADDHRGAEVVSNGGRVLDEIIHRSASEIDTDPASLPAAKIYRVGGSSPRGEKGKPLREDRCRREIAVHEQHRRACCMLGLLMQYGEIVDVNSDGHRVRARE